MNDVQAREEMYYLVCLEAIIVGAVSLPCFFLFQDHPKTPPRLKLH